MASSAASSGRPEIFRAARMSSLQLLAFLMPVVYLACVLALQPADHLGPPDTMPELGRLLWDDYDLAAMTLRGLNHRLDRTAGRLDPPPWLSREEFQEQLDRPTLLQPRYYLEYPHTALWLFHWQVLFVEDSALADMPAAVLDGDYHNLVPHQPRSENERRWWMILRRGTQVHAIGMTLCLLGLMVVLRAGYEDTSPAGDAWLLLLLPGMLYFTLNRFDIVPALLTALSFACLGRKYTGASAAFLAMAALVKVYPVLLVPLVWRYLGPNRRNQLVWLASFALTVGVLLLPPLLSFGWEAVLAPYRFQLSRPAEGWTLYGHLLPRRLAEADALGSGFRLGCLLLAEAALLWQRPADLASLIRRGGLILLLFVSLPVFYSPQWILWLCPLLLPLVSPGTWPASRRKPDGGEFPQAWLIGLIGLLDLVSYLSFPIVFDDTWGLWNALSEPLVHTRFILLASLALALIWSEFAAPRWRRSDPAARENG